MSPVRILGIAATDVNENRLALRGPPPLAPHRRPRPLPVGITHLRGVRRRSQRDQAVYNCDRISQRSGKSGRPTDSLRYAAPADPPVPRLVPIVRSTIFTCR